MFHELELFAEVGFVSVFFIGLGFLAEVSLHYSLFLVVYLLLNMRSGTDFWKKQCKFSMSAFLWILNFFLGGVR